jgi:hypothetical protein
MKISKYQSKLAAAGISENERNVGAYNENNEEK